MSTKFTNGKKAITFFQQHYFRVVQLEFVKWRPLSKMIPNNVLQHPMSGKPTWLPGYTGEPYVIIMTCVLPVWMYLIYRETFLLILICPIISGLVKTYKYPSE